MWLFRTQVSLLVSNGHPDAFGYPLGMVADEAKLISDRENSRRVTEAVVMQATISSVLSKEGGKHFKELLEQLNPETE